MRSEMHCPRCGQQQISEETKYCSRCGFQLGLVAELLANGGTLPQLEELYKRSGILTRRNGVIFSVIWCLFFLLIMTPFWGMVNVDELAGLSALIGIFGGLILMIISMAFFRKAPAPVIVDYAAVERQKAAQHAMHGVHGQPALPPQQTQPAASYMPPEGSWRAADTGEFAVPGSVTESTTKLLQKDE